MGIAPQDLDFMRMALDLAAEAATDGEVPVGAVVVHDGKVVGTGRNSPISMSDPTAHAEVLALRAAANAIGNYRLDGCTLYVTLEPCAMCCGAILHARMKRVVFGAMEPKTGCAGSVLNLFDAPGLNHQTQLEGGVLASEAAAHLQAFFGHKRQVQRVKAVPLREDALRTPDERFAHLPQLPWEPRFITDLPVLAGLRMHYLDVGAQDTARVVLCLHPIPGWSYGCRTQIARWEGEGVRVVAPDLVGFGRSDKPKRPALHTIAFHVSCVLQLLDHLGVERVHLVVPDGLHPIGQALVARHAHRITEVSHVLQAVALPDVDKAAVLDAPYPDAGYRAAERAFASPTFG